MRQSNGRQYLIAYCHAAEMEKTYRLDRIREIRAAEMCRQPDRFT
jgi:predicted DNA-binding transcriptional regulator YafY